MEEIGVFRLFNLVVGITGITVGLGIMLIPHIISRIEKKLDRNFSTESLEKILNKRRNLSEILLKNPKLFGLMLLAISFLLLVSSLTFF